MMLNNFQSGLQLRNNAIDRLVAVGGVMDQLGGDILLSFFENDDLTVTKKGSARGTYIGGGGGGGNRDGGGAEGGEVKKIIPIFDVGTHTVTVGARGLGASTSARGEAGGDTTINSDTAHGGGGGASGQNDTLADAVTGLGGGAGGNGWGGLGKTNAHTGYKGGDAGAGPHYPAGGGAGAGGNGTDGSGATGGDGGSPVSDDITGSSENYGAGAGGGVGQIGGSNTGGTGGDGAGDGGDDASVNGGHAKKLGAAGAGSAYNGVGGDGRSGAVFLRFKGAVPNFTGIDSLASSTFFASGSNGIHGLHLSKDGFLVTLCDYDNDRLYFNRLSTPYDLTSLSYDFATSFVTPDTPMGIDYSNDGTIGLISSYSNNYVAQYNLPAPYDWTGVSTTPAGTKTMSGGRLICPRYSKDGYRLYISDSDYVYEYSLSTPFDVTTMSGSAVSSKQMGSGSANYAFSFDYNGKWLYSPTRNGSTIQCCELGTPWDLSTAGTVTDISNPSGSYAWNGFHFSAHNKYVYSCHYGTSNYLYRSVITPN